ncbi:copia protein isoform X2 [Bombyx mori]
MYDYNIQGQDIKHVMNFFEMQYSGNILEDINKLQNIQFEITSKENKISEQTFMHKILNLLPEKFNTFKSIWNNIDVEKKNLDELTRRIKNELEFTKEDSIIESREILKGNEKRCFICNKPGHIARFCKNKKCDLCGKSGHSTDECYRNKICTRCSKKGHIKQFCRTYNSVSGNSKFIKINAIFDSGASSHMFSSKEFINFTEDIEVEIKCANKENLVATAVGYINTDFGKFENVLYVPGISRNLISVSCLTDNGATAIFENDKVTIKKLGKVILTGIKNKIGLYEVQIRVQFKKEVHITESCDLWHRRFGHAAGVQRFSKFLKGMKIKGDFSDNFCEICVRAKMCRHPFGKERIAAKSPLEIVHTDLCGPIELPTWDNHKYFVTFLDDFTHFSAVYLLSSKNDVFDKIKQFIFLAENHFRLKVKKIRCDNGTEYSNNSLISWCQNKGIVLDLTIPYTPQLNGKAERLNRTLMEKTRALLLDGAVPKYLWGEALLTASFLLNRCPTKGKNKTPAELWFGIKPDVSNIRRFGSTTYFKINSGLKKLDDRCKKGILVGYVRNGYKIWVEDEQKIIRARDVRINEGEQGILGGYLEDNEVINGLWGDERENTNRNNTNENNRADDEVREVREGDFRGINSNGVNEVREDVVIRQNNRGRNENRVERGRIINIEETDIFSETNEEETIEGETNDRGTNANETNENGTNDSPLTNENLVETLRSNDDMDEREEFLDSENTEGINEQVLENTRTGRPQRNRRPPDRYKDFIMEDGEFSLLTFEEAIESKEKENWLKAIKEEMDSLKENNTWSLVDKKEAEGRKLVTSKWIFSVKPDGRYKARLVARGFQQKYKIDYDETYSPVIDTTSLRILLSIAADKGLKLKQFDIKTAFLHGNLKETIYMKVPKGYNNCEGKVCKLNKSLYGLKQAPLMWNIRFTEFLSEIGFRQLKLNKCIFILDMTENKRIYLGIYVDDGIIIGENLKDLEEIINKLKKEFDLRVSEKVSNYIGLDIETEKSGIKLHQQKYSEKLLQKFNMNNVRDCNYPSILVEQHPSVKVDKKMHEEYREMVGSLLYLSNKTRPDISFHVGYCSRHQNSPNLNDLNNVKNILRFIKSSKEKGIHYSKGDNILRGFCDSDFAGDPDTRRSTSGFVIWMNGGPIAWSSRKQSVVALSSTEAEYIAAAECCKELLYIRDLVKEITNENLDIEMRVDNQSAIWLMKKGIMNKRSKHIDVKYTTLKKRLMKTRLKLNTVQLGHRLRIF